MLVIWNFLFFLFVSRKVKKMQRRRDKTRDRERVKCSIFCQAYSVVCICFIKCSHLMDREKSFELTACVQLNVKENKRHERQAANSKLPWSCPKFKYHTPTDTHYLYHIPVGFFMFLSWTCSVEWILICFLLFFVLGIVCCVCVVLLSVLPPDVCVKRIGKTVGCRFNYIQKMATEHKGGRENGKTEESKE